jgi:hypothetical protein
MPIPNNYDQLITALRNKPRTQSLQPITESLFQTLRGDDNFIENLRVQRNVQLSDGGIIANFDCCNLVDLEDGTYAVQYIIYDSGYETPDDHIACDSDSEDEDEELRPLEISDLNTTTVSVEPDYACNPQEAP